MTKIVPSILSADLGRLEEEIQMVEAAGADMLHVDVMDGHFVPNLTFGPMMVRKCKEITSLSLDVHLMITNAEHMIDDYIDAGADYISVHLEAVTHLQRMLEYIRKKSVRAGVALNPSTSLESLRWILGDLDFVLLMTVNPGYARQAFIPGSVEKIKAMRKMLVETGAEADIEVDGGVSLQNASSLITAGATMLVAGSAIFGAKEPLSALQQFLKH